MEKAALLVGGVALLVYATQSSGTNNNTHGPIDEDPLAEELHPGLTRTHSGSTHVYAPPLRLDPPPRHVLPGPPPPHGPIDEDPLAKHLQAPRRRLLPGPSTHLQPADPIGLVPLAPKNLQPPAIVGKPIALKPPIVGLPWRLQPSHKGVTGYSPCQLQIIPDNGTSAYQNLPQFPTYQSCQAASVPCPIKSSEGHCLVYWAPLQ